MQVHWGGDSFASSREQGDVSWQFLLNKPPLGIPVLSRLPAPAILVKSCHIEVRSFSLSCAQHPRIAGALACLPTWIVKTMPTKPAVSRATPRDLGPTNFNCSNVFFQ